jgi:hydrogenase expression/formation protein HypC
MCLGIPGQIVEILDEDIYLAKAEVGGVRRNINIGLVHHDEQRIEIGDWVLITWASPCPSSTRKRRT